MNKHSQFTLRPDQKIFYDFMGHLNISRFELSKNILEQAKELIGKDRQNDYGDKLTNHKNIAALWSIFLRKDISAHDVAMCMALVKVARLMHAQKVDSYIDIAAYAAIAGEINVREE